MPNMGVAASMDVSQSGTIDGRPVRFYYNGHEDAQSEEKMLGWAEGSVLCMLPFPPHHALENYRPS
jgi:hypothetical protein